MKATVKQVVRIVKRAIHNKLARYEVSAYEQGEAYEWGAHKAMTKRAALEWMSQYPARATVVVWNRRWQMVAHRAGC